MASSFTLALDTSAFTDAQHEMLARVTKAKAPLEQWALEEGQEITTEWDEMTAGRLSSGSAMFRGEVLWKQLSPKAIGRKRPSGDRMDAGDVVGKDTKDMVRDFISEPVLSPDELSISLVASAGYRSYQNALRPYNTPTTKTREILNRVFVDWLNNLIEAMRLRAAR